jgi:hypothetical protein
MGRALAPASPVANTSAAVQGTECVAHAVLAIQGRTDIVGALAAFQEGTAGGHA